MEMAWVTAISSGRGDTDGLALREKAGSFHWKWGIETKGDSPVGKPLLRRMVRRGSKSISAMANSYSASEKGFVAAIIWP
jgi:hypothetical protein